MKYAKGEERVEEKKDRLPDMELGKEFLAQVQNKDVMPDYWQQFLQTGRVQDYLNYRANAQEEIKRDF